ncbi:low-specificity L-threonine aldolase [Legionella sp. CNM-4043-24]|uniref:low-specificity L-threonine aldolase n=1 Tax=Legionella sp. CNM-4043-24 TaxID=3421646 RepID=UPI00403AD62E
MKTIDLRSDTVTRPSSGMYHAMINARLGDDVAGEDPSVNHLEAMTAELAGMEAAVFAPSGTQSNLMGIMAHCERGDEYIVGQMAHTYRWEGGGAAVLGSIQPQPLDFEEDGTLALDKVAQVIKPIDDHFARSRLLCLENTTQGRVLPLSYLRDMQKFCREKGLACHLDGARVFNAAVKLKVDLRSISQYVDSISICLSKGLGAPVGSLLCGSKELIQKARRWRKVLGGGMRQAGLLAAAGAYALEHQVARLQDDHDNAAILASGLAGIDAFEVDQRALQTNILFISQPDNYAGLYQHLLQRGIAFPKQANSQNRLRLVTHLDVNRQDIQRVVDEVKAYYALNRSAS